MFFFFLTARSQLSGEESTSNMLYREYSKTRRPGVAPWLPANEWHYSAAMRTAEVLVGTGEHNAAGESL